MRLQKGDKILFIGDSITDCGRAQPVGEGSGLGSGWVSFVDALLTAQHPGLHLRVFNVGSSGHTSRDLVGRWQRDVLDLKPDWISIMIGVNDVWRQFDTPHDPGAGIALEPYQANLRRMVDETKGRVKGIVLMTPFFLEPCLEDRMRARLDQYGAFVREFAAEEGCVLVDAQAAMDRFLEHHHSSFIGWDRVHVNTTGNMILALEWVRVVGC